MVNTIVVTLYVAKVNSALNLSIAATSSAHTLTSSATLFANTTTNAMLSEEHSMMYQG